MKGIRSPYRIYHKVASVVMLLALAWLTISLPFVYSFQQAQKAAAQKPCVQTAADSEEESSNPLTNNNEEKSESGVTQLSEYLHDHELLLHAITMQTPLHIGHQCDLHLDVHPEFFSPPPEGLTA